MASSPIRMPNGRNEPKPPCTRVRSLIHSSGVSARAVVAPPRTMARQRTTGILFIDAAPPAPKRAAIEYADFMTTSYQGDCTNFDERATGLGAMQSVMRNSKAGARKHAL